MAITETKPGIRIPEGFGSPSPAITLFIVGLISYVEKNKVLGESENFVNVSVRSFNSNPLFFHAFYYQQPRFYPDGTYLLAGLDKKEGTHQVNGQSHDLYRSYELIYDPTQGFEVIALQTAVPNPYEGGSATILWRSKMSKKGIQRLGRKLFINS